jgi:hypothetical protein
VKAKVRPGRSPVAPQPHRCVLKAILATEMASSHLQRFDARPARECEHCKSEAPAVKHLEWLVLTEGRDLVRHSERELVSRYGALT